MTDHQIAQKILMTLEKQRFADWYQPGGRFDSYITVDVEEGKPGHVSKDDILQDVMDLFGLDE